MKNHEPYHLCYELLRECGYYNYSLSFIMSKTESKNKHYLAYATSNEDPEEMILINIDFDSSYNVLPVAEWDFNIEDYLLEPLENGYELDYMPLKEHYNVWCSIDELRDDISHQDGLQKYLSYCQSMGITKHEIGLLQLEQVDIMDLYIEKNCNFQIIASTSIGNNTIVLGYNPKKDEYVTWSTSPTRKYGYDIGHYLSSYKKAFSDYRQRCTDMLDKHLSFEKNKTKPHEKKGQER